MLHRRFTRVLCAVIWRSGMRASRLQVANTGTEMRGFLATGWPAENASAKRPERESVAAMTREKALSAK